MDTVESRIAWQRSQLSRLEGILNFLDSIANDDALLADSNPVDLSQGITIAESLLRLGLSKQDEKRFSTVGEVRAYIAPFRDYVTKHLQYLSKMDLLDSNDPFGW